MTPEPFLKWAGGKRRLLPELLKRIPASFRVYHEPFLGSGALFFSLWRAGRIQKACLSDKNEELIDTYVALRDCVTDVEKLLKSYQWDQEFYYQLREQDPKRLSMPERAARMIYLNKTGYNGLYRVNRQGKFNVPFGKFKRPPRFYDKENLYAVSQALQKVDLFCASFETLTDRAQASDFVYCDPPYMPISSTANFTSYLSTGFSPSDHERLRDVCFASSQLGAYVMISHSSHDLIRSLYQMPFLIFEVTSYRAIGCKNRRNVPELIITTYEPEAINEMREKCQ